MGKIGYGYGSEWHLLRYLGRHRDELDHRILTEVGGESVAWLDAPFCETAPFDAEWKGVAFLPETDPARTAWLKFWPQTGNVPNWDVVAVLARNGMHEWLLVEAKAYVQEARSSCAAKEKGGLAQIASALQAVKSALGVASECDWLKGYYQYCNRIAVLHFLREHGVTARLVFIYFTGDRREAGPKCPQTEAEWMAALQQLDKHVGLPSGHLLGDRIHKLFLPVTMNGASRLVDTWSQPRDGGGMRARGL